MNLSILSTAIFVISKEAKRIRDERDELKAEIFENHDPEAICNIYAYCVYGGTPLDYDQYRDYWHDMHCGSECDRVECDTCGTETRDECTCGHADSVSGCDCDDGYSDEDVTKLERSVAVCADARNAQHERLAELRDEKAALYDDLKSPALAKAKAEGVAEVLGYHKFADCDRELLHLGGRSFHGEEVDGDITDLECLGDIATQISADNSNGNMNINEATQIVKSYLR